MKVLKLFAVTLFFCLFFIFPFMEAEHKLLNCIYEVEQSKSFLGLAQFILKTLNFALAL